MRTLLADAAASEFRYPLSQWIGLGVGLPGGPWETAQKLAKVRPAGLFPGVAVSRIEPLEWASGTPIRSLTESD